MSLHKKRIFVDVREPAECREGAIKGAINLPLSQLETIDFNADGLIGRDTEIICYCNTGGRSELAVQIFNRRGFKSVVNGINSPYVKANFIK